MTHLIFTLLVLCGSFGAGLLGALTGLGGGVVLVPMLALAFHVDLRYAIGASLIAVIATSSGAAAAYLREGYSNLRIAMFLELATTVGALAGAAIAGFVPTSAIAVLFGAMLLHSAYLSRKSLAERDTVAPDPLAAKLRLNSQYPTEDGPRHYEVSNVKSGFGVMFIAGGLSGLLGIGSGAVKVLAMDHVMRIPFKVSTTTSNFMIGVTAAASAGVYLGRGYIDPVLSMPVMLGVLGGSMVGARILMRAQTKMLRTLFSVVITVLGLQMIYKGFTGGL